MMRFFWRALRRGERGFTLIELLIVVAIIAILAAVLIPNFLRARGQSRIAASKGNMKNVGTALESYFVDNGVYPSTLGLLVSSYYVGAIPRKPNGVPYYYNVNTSAPANTFYVVCDEVTDTNISIPTGTLTWYYTPTGGLASSVTAATSVTVSGVTCP